MDFAFNEEQRLLRAAVADLLEVDRTVQPARRPDDCSTGTDLAERLTQAGLNGVLVSIDLGGSGLSLVEGGLILEGLGAVLSGRPFLVSSVVAASLLAALPVSSERDKLLSSIAFGRSVVLPLIGDGVPFTINGSAGRRTIGGRVAWQPHGIAGDVLLVVVRDPDAGEMLLVALSPNAPGVSVTHLDLPDASRDVCSVHLEQVALGDALQVWSLPADAAARAPLVAAAGLAAEMLGGAVRVLDLACQHARDRQQFGQPIGRFQAIKHLLANDQVMLDGLQSLVYAALWRLAHGSANAAATAHAAKAWAGDVSVQLASDAIQVFGAMGIAAESLPHRYLKRSQVDRMCFGAAARHLDALATEDDAAR